MYGVRLLVSEEEFMVDYNVLNSNLQQQVLSLPRADDAIELFKFIKLDCRVGAQE
jgi:hypothetical protein